MSEGNTVVEKAGLTENSIKVLENRYLKKDETGKPIEAPEDMFMRVAAAVAQGESVYGANESKVKYYRDCFYDEMMSCRFMPNSPTLMNAGRGTKGMTLSACYVLPIEDSIDGIFDTVKTTALIQKAGGGTGFCLDRLRPTGDYINSSGGTTSGPMSFWKVLAETTNAIQQGAFRRGANMMMMRVDHPDVLKFLFAKQDLGKFQNYNISLKITDEWMELLRENPKAPNPVMNFRTGKKYILPKELDVHNYQIQDLVPLENYTDGKFEETYWSLEDVWETLVKNAWLTGEPGLAFPDRWNQYNPTPNVGEYEATNPCVPAGTRILTQEGYLPIETLVGKKVAVWNGKQWSEVEPRVTGHNQELLKVEFSDGTVLTCTKGHKFVLADDSRKEAQELNAGDVLMPYDMPFMDGGEKLTYDAYTHGVFVGDGQENSAGSSKGILLYGEKRKLIPYLDGTLTNPTPDKYDRVYFGIDPNMPGKTFVPINASLKDRLAWLSGFIDTDGSLTLSPNGSYFLNNSNLPLLRDVQLLLNTLGSQSKLSKSKDACDQLMPDGKGGKKMYHCEPCYRIIVKATDTSKLIKLGLKSHRIPVPEGKLSNGEPKVSPKFVVSIAPAGIADTVYCFTEPVNHTGTFEGVVSAQCGEQNLLSKESCNLGSINLGLFVEESKKNKENSVNWLKLKETIHLTTRFLENVVEVNHYPTDDIDKICRSNRKIGLGVMGFADALYKLGIPYNSEEGIKMGEKFMKFVNDEAHNASEKLAEERGVFANWEGSRWETEWKRKQRNACSTTVAPTGTISIIANCSGGIEPLFSLAFYRRVMRDHTGKPVEMVEVNPIFKQVAEEANFWGYKEKDLFDKIAKEGTLHNVNEIPESVKKIFVCAHDITPEWHVKMQAAFQKHCDSSISKTINFPNNATVDDVRKVYEMAFDLGCKGVTVYRDGCRKGQPMALKESEKVKEPVKITPQRAPEVISAVRIRQATPFGHMHVSITVDVRNNQELEVFAQLGKAGDVAASDLEAMCRMVSLFLRSGGSLEPVVKQLEGIGSSLSIPSKDGRILSLGDALGKTIKKYLSAKNKHGLKALLLGEVSVSEEKVEETPVSKYTKADEAMSSFKLKCPECEVGNLVFMEGCRKCNSCGASAC